jgi:hypothetical protein
MCRISFGSSFQGYTLLQICNYMYYEVWYLSLTHSHIFVLEEYLCFHIYATIICVLLTFKAPSKYNLPVLQVLFEMWSKLLLKGIEFGFCVPRNSCRSYRSFWVCSFIKSLVTLKNEVRWKWWPCLSIAFLLPEVVIPSTIRVKSTLTHNSFSMSPL